MELQFNKIEEKIFRDCAYYIDLLKNCKRGYFLLRGTFNKIDGIQKFQHDSNFRKPRDTPQNIHDKINDFFLEKFGWKIRNGVFTYGFDVLSNEPTDLGYGDFKLFFPIGDFNFVQNSEHFDLYGALHQRKTDIDTFISGLQFYQDDLCASMNTRQDYHDFGNETSIKTNEYYLVNLKFAEELAIKIWPII